ncbi:hypothetical protein CBQ26_11920 [Deinococcus indicus]|uniref:Uncharacterized protein n=1 Tax=Deinococcus indicus TaxID=223556 RepID=A0A246BJI0_9DEIO|nr:hypothetical protein [Deinococcus indicus]OWL95461.1 hypothetical protein CBQ26_11920 [Deinococcus indicus]
MLDKLEVLDHQKTQVLIGGLKQPVWFRHLIDSYLIDPGPAPRNVEVWYEPSRRLTIRLSRVDVERGQWDVTIWP